MTGPAVVALPVVSYREVDPDALLPASVPDSAAVPFGFNDGSTWAGLLKADEKEQEEAAVEDGVYSRWIQPLESELAAQVEYDMDEQDQVWLDSINADRERDGLGGVSYEYFEIIVDKLEKEWFNLTKRVPKRHNPAAYEDSKCAICDDGECENSNAIVFCDGCNLAVHQDCYGVPYIPEGQWLCRKCTVSPDKLVSCVLCPNPYGAFKQTTTAQWAHLLCAIWVPDTGVSNTVYMEPIDGVENISKSRWKLVCYLCKKRVGACIQCANRSCFSAFHVTCARERALELKMKQGVQGGELRAYCEKHSHNFTPPPPMPKAHRRMLAIGRLPGNKSALAYKKSYASAPPLVPALVADAVMAYISTLSIANKNEFVSVVCRYWSLKREARRGAPLLKRLHLEPWTASASAQQRTDAERARRLELIVNLRNDLEKVRMLTEQVRKREQGKLRRVKLFKAFVEDSIFAVHHKMRALLVDLNEWDKHKYFEQPVSKLLVEDYYDIVLNPMDFRTMGQKLDNNEYSTAKAFADDVALVVSNAKLYNPPSHAVYRDAVRIESAAEGPLAELLAFDEHQAVVQRHMAEVLTLEAVDDLFQYGFDGLEDADLDSDDGWEGEAKAEANGVPSVSPVRARKLKRGGYRPRKRKEGEVDLEPRPKKVLPPPRPNGLARTTRRSSGAFDVPAAETEPLSALPATPAQAEKKLAVVEEQPNLEPDPSTSTPRSLRARPSLALPPAPATPVEEVKPSGRRLSRAQQLVAESPATPASRSSSRASHPPAPWSASDKGKQRATPTAHAPIAANETDSPKTPANRSSKGAAPTPAAATPSKPKQHQARDWDATWDALPAHMKKVNKSQLSDGTVVWVTVKNQPYVPGEWADPKAPDTDQDLLDDMPADAVQKRLQLVLLFDETRSAQWVPLSDLLLLGEHAEIDELMQQDAVLFKRRWHDDRIQVKMKEIRDAYQEALDTIETDEDRAAREAEEARTGEEKSKSKKPPRPPPPRVEGSRSSGRVKEEVHYTK